MNYFDKYSVIHNYICEEPKVQAYTPTVVNAAHLLSNIKVVTIAEIAPASRDLITAHRLKDYRRKTFSLLLLPDIQLPIDSLLGEVPALSDFKEFNKVGV